MRRSLGRIVFGVVLIAFGIVSLLENFGYDIHINFDGWWTAFIIVPCLVSLIDDGVRPGNLIGLLIGASLLAKEQNWIPDAIRPLFSWQLLLIVGGVALLFGRRGMNVSRVSDEYHSETKERKYFDGRRDDTEFPDYFAFFGGSDILNTSSNLRGASITCIFGGIEADFSRATIKEDITIHVTSIFGGSEVYLPSNVRVRFTGVPIFGGVSNSHQDVMSDQAPVVTINSFSLFGGSEIR